MNLNDKDIHSKIDRKVNLFLAPFYILSLRMMPYFIMTEGGNEGKS